MSQAERSTENKRSNRREAAVAKNGGDGWKGFVNVELTEKQKPEAKKMMADFARLWDNVVSLVDIGYKMTFSYDEGHDAYNLSLTCRDVKSPNYGYTLSGRGGSEAAAFASFWYKHSIILEEVWTNGAATSGGKFQADDMS